jgi:hypothetical protein
MSSRNWAGLSPGYRKRLEKGGVTKRQYESGQSLEKARGHEHTPERPERASTKDEAYKDYRDRKNKLIKNIQDFKTDRFGRTPRWNKGNSLKVIKNDPATGKARGIKELRAINAIVDLAIEDELYDWFSIVDLDDEYESAFYYH